LKSGDLNKIEKALQPSYLTPQNSNRYVSAVQILEANKLYDLSYKYAKIATEFNPNSFEAWAVLYYSQATTPNEKVLAEDNASRLDPLNPNRLIPSVQ
jgi:hypothetical protein